MPGTSIETRDVAIVEEKKTAGDEHRPTQESSVAEGHSEAARVTMSVTIASTFTIEPLLPPLRFWMDRLEIGATVVSAAYAQVIQNLLDPDSILSNNTTGIVILVVRLEDWIRQKNEKHLVAAEIPKLRQTAHDFAAAVRMLRRRIRAPIFAFLCPPSSSLHDDYAKEIGRIHDVLASDFSSIESVSCLGHVDVQTLYPVPEYEDPRADSLGHIPYTTDYFVALGTLLARRIATLVKPRYKVIAVDCDNTLWKGICGEDGPLNLELTPAHLELQTFLIRQKEMGMLLCLCSKNNPEDVEAVFKINAHMLLRKDHVVASRVNWSSKSENLRSLAKELDLSLDAFIFMDDSAVECAEVKTNCPSVLTLKVPDGPNEMTHLLAHTWAFDSMEVTDEARRRTELYKENQLRRSAFEKSSNLEQFIASLELVVDASPVDDTQLRRATELINRTNQFNMTGRRRLSGELKHLIESGDLFGFVIRVRDRFGDYGVVGVVLYRRKEIYLDVDTFLLSCRVLGRGVEVRVINKIGEIAASMGLSSVLLRYRETARNRPARDFLWKHFAKFQVPGDEEKDQAENTFTVPSSFAVSLGNASSLSETEVYGGEESPGKSGYDRLVTPNWVALAYQLSAVPDIVREMRRLSPSQHRRSGVFVAPRTSTEAAVAAIWSEILGVQEIGARDDFFELGGDSIAAVRVVARVGSTLGFDLALDEFFAGSTVQDIAAKLADAPRSETAIPHMPGDLPRPLSSAQQRLWFIDQLEGQSVAYHIQVSLKFIGRLDIAALESAITALIQRHESLRTVFASANGEPTQLVRPTSGFKLSTRTVIGSEIQNVDTEITGQAREDQLTPFDLRDGPLIRGTLIAVSPEEHVLLLTMHHLVSDGWSIRILFRELVALYRASAYRVHDTLQALSITYADYAEWQRRGLDSSQMDAQVAYWRSHLEGAPSVLELSTDKPRQHRQSYRGGSVKLKLENDLAAEVRALSQHFGLTLAMVLFAAWSALLARLSGQDDVVVGIPVANRRRTEVEGLIGFFANTLAVRTKFRPRETVQDLLISVREAMISGYSHQDAPFDKVVEAVRPERSLNRSPIFQAMFVLQERGEGVVTLPGLEISEHAVPLYTAQFDLLLSLQESSGGLDGMLNYSEDLFERETIENWAECFKTLLRGMTDKPLARVSDLPLMSGDLWAQLHQRTNSLEQLPKPDRLIHEVFEEQADRSPDSVAVTHERRALTYWELEARANQLARYLQRLGVQDGSLVGICMDRGVEIVIGILAILKAGGGYVPLDPRYPRERLTYVIADISPDVVLTSMESSAFVGDTSARVVAIDAEWASISLESRDRVQAGSENRTERRLAYVIYTSGSTGKPKGVMVDHQNVIRLFSATARWFDFGPQDVWTLFHSFAFDFSVWELWGALLHGGRVVLVPYMVSRSPREFYDLVCNEGVTVLNQTPGAFAQLVEAQKGASDLKTSLRCVVFGGEALDLRSLQPWARRHGAERPRLINMYGITETTVHVTISPLSIEDIERGSGRSIGRPIPDLRMYLLDRNLRPVPIGVAGEIYVGGAGVARGYLHRPELTAERFLSDPLASDQRDRMYKTGDLGRLRADGIIEYLGRNDHQVKIRGYRIELGEIEAHLERHPRVSDAVVLARDDVPGEKRLVAYIVPVRSGVADPAIDGGVLQEYLKALLPGYMVPSVFLVLEALPLTSNGKLDRRALPAPEYAAYVSRQYEPPRGRVEGILADIWSSLLGVTRVGRHDGFFEMGGHSLLIAKMMESLRRVGLSIEVRRLFENQTLAEVADSVRAEDDSELTIPENLIPAGCLEITPSMLTLIDLKQHHIETIEKTVPGGAANIQDIYPLAPLQQGILFHHLLNKERGDTYVLPTVLWVESRERVDELIVALQAVIDRHDILRTAVLWEDLPEPVQVVCRKVALPVKYDRIGVDRELSDQIMDWIEPSKQRLDLRLAPPVRVRIATGQQNDCYVVIQLHHIICDHITTELIISEVVAHLEGRHKSLPKSAPYRNHVALSLKYARTPEAQEFFSRKLGRVEEPTVPFGFSNVRGDGGDVKEWVEPVDSSTALRLRGQARILGVSVATLFHAAWGLVVSHTSGRDEVVFGSVLLGRLRGHGAMERTFGMFINTLPLILRLRDISAQELVRQTQQELGELLNHEQAPLAVAQRCSGVAGSAALFSTLLNFRHSAPNPEAEWERARGVRRVVTQERTNYPISVSVDDLGQEFTITAQCASGIDPGRIAGYLRTAAKSLVDALESAPQKSALSLPFVPENELRELTESFNDVGVVYRGTQLAHTQFEAQVRKTPGAIALEFQGTSLTYAALNDRANQLAWYLRDLGIGPNKLVAICVQRSPDLVVGMLGILKAGGAYLPLDPHYPMGRLSYMLENASPSVLLTQESLKAKLPATSAEVLVMDCDWHKVTCWPTSDLLTSGSVAGSDDLAYVIYTSGSTGVPKAAQVMHRGLRNLLSWYTEEMGLSSRDSVLLVTSQSFDLTQKNILSPLGVGGTLHLADEPFDAVRIVEQIRTEKITHINLTPSAFYALVDADVSGDLGCLERVVLGGEPIATEKLMRFSKSRTRIINSYGPTECSDVVAYHPLLEDLAVYRTTPVPIGKPIGNVRLYVLDGDLRPAPVGAAGEIWVGGIGVGAGYLNAPALTAERFLADPISGDQGARLYRTGDLGKWHADGQLVYLGRNDSQVKIRGFRIELGEVEASLERLEAVKQAVVVTRQDLPGATKLVAYIVPDTRGGGRPSVESMREHLKLSLPDYMIPEAVVFLDTLPLTPSGKLDRRALPAPDPTAYVRKVYEPPQGHFEESLAEIWKMVLRVPQVGRSDSFFDLGGHSLLAMQVMVRVRARFLIDIPMVAFFDHPTLKELAAELSSARERSLAAMMRTGDGDIASLVAKIESMSDRDAKELSEKLRAGSPS